MRILDNIRPFAYKWNKSGTIFETKGVGNIETIEVKFFKHCHFFIEIWKLKKNLNITDMKQFSNT